jgi:hypothetical protein
MLLLRREYNASSLFTGLRDTVLLGLRERVEKAWGAPMRKPLWSCVLGVVCTLIGSVASQGGEAAIRRKTGVDAGKPAAKDAATSPKQSGPSAAEIAQWVRDLGAEKSVVRQRAEAALVAADESALEAVQAVTNSPDEEVRARARRIVEKIRAEQRRRKPTWDSPEVAEIYQTAAADEDPDDPTPNDIRFLNTRPCPLD